MIIKGFIKNSLVDYPGKISSVIFVAGCNFRCGYCYNRHLVLNDKDIPEIRKEDILGYLRDKKKWIDAVVICGGEPLLYDLEDFIIKIKKLGYLVKIDTNGSMPVTLKNLLDRKLVDYVAMDIKATWENYSKIAGVDVDLEKIKESIRIIKASGVDYEFRCTILPEFNVNDIIRIAKMLNNPKKLCLQQFKPVTTIDENYLKKKPKSIEELKHLKDILKDYAEKIILRGV